MSFYFQSKFIVTDHCLVRLKQRIPRFKEMSNLLAEASLKDLLRQLQPEFQDAHTDYYFIERIKGKDYYAVVRREKHLITTIKPISANQKIGF